MKELLKELFNFVFTVFKRHLFIVGVYSFSTTSAGSSYLVVAGPKQEPQTLDDVTKLLKSNGITDIGLIIGIDFTMSNEIKGVKTFGGRSLHDTGVPPNPYITVICTLGETLGPLDDDGVIPAYGFGDSSVKDTGVFPLKTEGECVGFTQVLQAYKAVLNNLQLGGPTNFAPIIEKTVEIVKEKPKFHILLIIADGQVSKEEETIEAIVKASDYPVSIVTIGVGDGPWGVMDQFCQKLQNRRFDNFHFVDFNKVVSGANTPEVAFAVAALEKIPKQYAEIQKLKLL